MQHEDDPLGDDNGGNRVAVHPYDEGAAERIAAVLNAPAPTPPPRYDAVAARAKRYDEVLTGLDDDDARAILEEIIAGKPARERPHLAYLRERKLATSGVLRRYLAEHMEQRNRRVS